jgi:polysaccharide pyruvyl transferase WcaK-like protein
VIIEVYGANFMNKGAELMLLTTKRELSARMPGAQVAMHAPYDKSGRRASIGVKSILTGRGRLPWWAEPAAKGRELAKGILPGTYRAVLTRSDWVDDSMLDALVDVSGFAFSDQWGPGLARRFARLAECYFRRGKPVVLLPQAMGPFTDPEVRSAFRRITAHADLVYARDRLSFGYALKVTEFPERLRQAADITLFDGAAATSSTPEQGDVCWLIPNSRMLDLGADEWREHYVESLELAGRRMLESGADVRVLVHSREAADVALGERLIAAMPGVWPAVVQEDDPRQVKRLLGLSRAVVGSRYHGLVGAFAQGVPSIGLGWSHKYTGLYDDFGMDRFCFERPPAKDELVARVDEILDPVSRRSLAMGILSSLDALNDANGRTWESVCEVLRRQ